MIQSDIDFLGYIARKTLETNIVKCGERHFLLAGEVQYKAIWVRDAAHSSSALAKIKRNDVVYNHIMLYLENVEDSFKNGPRCFDTVPCDFRSVSASTRRFFCLGRKPLEFLGESEQRKSGFTFTAGIKDTIDSNLLVILSIFECDQKNSFLYPETKWVKTIVKMLSLYDLSGELISQPPFSDWQESQNRSGPVFLTNLMFCRALSLLSKNKLSYHANLPVFLKRVLSTFFDPISGLFNNSPSANACVSLDGNLLCIKWTMLSPEKSKQLWECLKKHPLWLGRRSQETGNSSRCRRGIAEIDTGFPGFATYPDYPLPNASLITRFAGLQHYHDSMYWSWLMALSAEVAYQMDDLKEGDRIASNLLKLLRRDNYIADVYSHHPDFPPVKTMLYESEHSFSWGAAYVIDMLSAREKCVLRASLV